MKNLKLGYSPCPNDTYIMAALALGRTGTSLDIEHILADVENLNQWAVQGRLEATKLSFMALGRVRETYGLLYSGAALGWGCGPLLVARRGWTLDRLHEGRVAAPGELTTATLLLSLFHGQELDFRQMIFSQIIPAVARGEAEFGLIIHEGRFTFTGHGLVELLDLGAWWEGETGCPIPLGGIAVRRDLGPEIAAEVDRAIGDSLMQAEVRPSETMQYVLTHSQEMSQEVITRHIGLYVNSFSRRLSTEGREAIDTLFSRAEEAGLIPRSSVPLMAYDI